MSPIRLRSCRSLATAVSPAHQWDVAEPTSTASSHSPSPRRITSAMSASGRSRQRAEYSEPRSSSWPPSLISRFVAAGVIAGSSICLRSSLAPWRSSRVKLLRRIPVTACIPSRSRPRSCIPPFRYIGSISVSDSGHDYSGGRSIVLSSVACSVSHLVRNFGLSSIESSRMRPSGPSVTFPHE